MHPESAYVMTSASFQMCWIPIESSHSVSVHTNANTRAIIAIAFLFDMATSFRSELWFQYSSFNYTPFYLNVK